jgi:hypothetical protein
LTVEGDHDKIFSTIIYQKRKDVLIMKRTLLYVGSVFILILSAVTFIFVPAMLHGAPKGLVFGKYDGKKIELTQGSEFATSVANFGDLYKNQGQSLNDSAYFYIYNFAFNATVSYLAGKDAVKASGYEPTATSISRAMLPYFSDENGNYSAKLYNRTSEATRNTIKKDLENKLAWTRYYEDVFGTDALKTDGYFEGLTCLQYYGNYVQLLQIEGTGKLGKNSFFGLKTSDAETEFLANLGTAKRSFDLAAWDKTNYPDQEVIMYGVDHYDLFNKHDLSVISLDDKAQAEKILGQIKNNEVTFEDAIKEFSKKYYTGDDGKLSSNYEYQIKEIIPGEEDFKSIIALEKDEVSPVIQAANNSYSIFRRNEKRDLNHLNVEKNIDVVRNYLESHEAGISEEYNVNIAKDFAASAVANGFDRACKDAKVTKVSVPAFALSYGDNEITGKIPSDIKELQGAANNENFLEKVFALKNGQVSEPLILGNNVLVLKMTGEQKEAVTDESKKAVEANVLSFDATGSRLVLNSSDKVENNVQQVFFNDIMANRSK